MYIDCCVKRVYSVVGYLFAQKIGVSFLVFIGILVVILERSPSLAEAPLANPRSLRSENRNFAGPDTQLPKVNFQEITALVSVGVCGLIFSYSCLMQAAPMWAGGGGGGAHGGGGGRAVTLPPRWGPSMERSYSFLDWTQDLLTWSILSDMDPARQCAAIITQLDGSARLLARNMTFDDITRG